MESHLWFYWMTPRWSGPDSLALYSNERIAARASGPRDGINHPSTGSLLV